MLDGCEVLAEDKVKAENLHGVDLNDRETIFKTLLPQETFVDRRVATFELLENESEDDDATEPAALF
jgi:protein phosphatase 1 regulatory subunit 7